MREALSRVDVRTAEIIACHLAIESELDRLLAEVIPHPEHLRRLGFGHKVGVLRACFDHDLLEMSADAFGDLEDLRNAIAHPRDKKQVRGAWRKLCGRLRVDPETASVAGVANVLTNFLVMLGKELTPIS